MNIKFKNLDQVSALYRYLNWPDLATGNAYLDSLLGSIIEDISLRVYNKYAKNSIRPLALKQHEAIALITFYLQQNTKVPANEAPFIYTAFTDIHKKIAHLKPF